MYLWVDKNFIDSDWEFRVNRFAFFRLWNLKLQICDKVYQQVKWVDYFYSHNGDDIGNQYVIGH